jgi:hypothetical protein
MRRKIPLNLCRLNRMHEDQALECLHEHGYDVQKSLGYLKSYLKREINFTATSATLPISTSPLTKSLPHASDTVVGTLQPHPDTNPNHTPSGPTHNPNPNPCEQMLDNHYRLGNTFDGNRPEGERSPWTCRELDLFLRAKER